MVTVAVLDDGTTRADLDGGASLSVRCSADKLTWTRSSGKAGKVACIGPATVTTTAGSTTTSGPVAATTTLAPTTTTTIPATTTVPPAEPTATCPAYPAFPDGNCTGWRHTGVTLAPYTGPMTITASGTTIDSALITGYLQIKAANVTIKRSQVNGNIDTGYGDSSNVVIEDVEINAGNSVYSALGQANFTCRRCNIYGAAMGVNAYNFTVEDSWIHDLYGTEAVHSEAILGYNGNIVIRHNRLSGNYNSASGGFNPTDGGMSSSVSLYTHWGPMSNVVMEKNWLNVGTGDRDWAGYCLYAGGATMSASTFKDNVFANHPLNPTRCGYYGTVADRASGAGTVWSGNRLESGEPV